MESTLLFYDLETTGLQKAFDQVVQFAAIRTDMALREIQRYELLIRPTRGVVPSAEATITHRISPGHAERQGIFEWEAIRQIHAWMNEPGTISGGYNTLGFDDEFLRFSFYRHLLTPYTHQYAGRCGRFDLYPLTALYAQHAPQALSCWPTKPDGHLSLKLEDLAQAHGWLRGQAHHAMNDVEATVALARAMRDHDLERWQYGLSFFQKQADVDRVMKLKEQSLAVMLSGSLGSARGFQVPVTYLGAHEVYRNQTLWLRLDGDWSDEASCLAWAEQGGLMRKKWAEAPLALPWRFHQSLSEDVQAVAEQHRQWLSAHASFVQTCRKQWCQQTYPVVPHIHPQAALYQAPFWSQDTQRWCQAFHQQVDIEASVAWMQQHPCPDEQVAALSRWLGARHGDASAPSIEVEALSSTMRGELDLTDHRGDRPRSYQDLKDSVSALKDSGQSFDQEQCDLLAELGQLAERYCTSVMS